MEAYKKWIIVVIAAVAGGIIVVSFIAKQSYRPEKPVSETAERSPMPAGPLVDRDFNRVIPVEELDVDASNPQSLAILGDKYFEKRNYNQAIEIYKKVLEINPNDVDTYNDLGLAYYYTGRSALAIELLKKGTEVMPSFQRTWLSFGFVLMSTGNNEEAKSALTKAAELNPQTDVGQEAMRMLGSLK
jgi:tetratricopeptide (TPR) repeat protein